MLRVEFVNDGTGADDAANYDVRVVVNHRTIAATTVKGHPRDEHWTGLLARCAAQNDPRSGNQPPSGVRGDPVVRDGQIDGTRDQMCMHINKLEAALDHLRARLGELVDRWQARSSSASAKCAADLLAVLTEPPQEDIRGNGPINAIGPALDTEGDTP